MPLVKHYANAWSIGGLSVHPRNRAAPVHWEWHTWGKTYYLMFGLASPRKHARWAFTAYLDLPAWIARTPLARVPSTGHRTWYPWWIKR